MIVPTKLSHLTDAQQRALRTLGDGAWRKGSRVSCYDNSTILSTVGSYLYAYGLAERRGSSRLRPSNPGFEYRITQAGLDVLRS